MLSSACSGSICKNKDMTLKKREAGIVSTFDSRLILMHVTPFHCKRAPEPVFAPLQHAQPNKDIRTCITFLVHTATPHQHYVMHLTLPWHCNIKRLQDPALHQLLLLLHLFSALWAAQTMMNLITLCHYQALPNHPIRDLYQHCLQCCWHAVPFDPQYCSKKKKKDSITSSPFTTSYPQRWIEAQLAKHGINAWNFRPQLN